MVVTIGVNEGSTAVNRSGITRISGVVLSLLGLTSLVVAVLAFGWISSDKESAYQEQKDSNATIERAVAARNANDTSTALKLFDQARQQAKVAQEHQRSADTDLMLAEAFSGIALISLVAGPALLVTSRRRPETPEYHSPEAAERAESIARAVSSFTAEYALVAEGEVVTEHILRIGGRLRAHTAAALIADEAAAPAPAPAQVGPTTLGAALAAAGLGAQAETVALPLVTPSDRSLFATAVEKDLALDDDSEGAASA